MNTLFKFLALSVLALNALTPLEACTGIKLTAKDGSTVSGRTLEFGVQVETQVVVIPRGYQFSGTTSQGPGLSYKSKYAVLGAIAFGNLAVMDGINEKGMAAGIFYFPGYAKYSLINEQNRSKAVSPAEFVNWLLTQFATLQEVKEGLANVVIAPTVVKEWGTEPPPFHYVVYDKSGNSLVIEPIEGKLVTYDNPLGVLTNSPKFDWHMTNLRNYLNLTTVNAAPRTLNGIELTPFGQGSGMVGLPGDFTPPSRFVRAAIFSATAIPSKNADEAILQAFHILNQFDIPVGVVRAVEEGIIHTDSTLMTCARDPQALKFYFRSYEDQTIHVVDMKKFDLDAKTVKSADVNSQQPIVDITDHLK